MTIFDIMEYMAVFLLAVEAIKLENLKLLVGEFLKPLILRMNPKLKLVHDSSSLGFFKRNVLAFIFFGFYVFGFLIILTFFYVYSFDPIAILRGANPVYWLVSIFVILLLPFVVGFLPYQMVVWALEISVRCLTWVQVSTHTGVVGIIGFVLFTFQFWGRRVFS